MRFAKYLACATLVARAETIEEDDDLQFMRVLSSNASNANTTSTSSTTSSSTNATNTTSSSSTTPSSNTTSSSTTKSSSNETSSSSTTQPSSNNETTTKASTTPKEGEPKDTVSQEDKAKGEELLAALKSNSTENVSTTATEVVKIEVKATGADPFYCKLAGLTTGTCAVTTTAAPSNSTRMLANHGNADLTKAHNVFCGAFSFAGSYAVCSAMSDAQVVGLFTPSATLSTVEATKKTQVNKAVSACVTGLTVASIIPGGDNCYQATGAPATNKGVCFANSAEIAAVAAPNADRITPGVKACTKSTGTDPQTMDFKTETDLNIPTWRTTGGTASAITVDTTALKSSAETKAADPAAMEVLQTALVLSAVEITTNIPAAAAEVSVATAIGLTDDQLTAVATQVNAGGGVANMDLSQVTDKTSQPAALKTVMDTALTAVKAAYTPTVTAGSGGGGSTSAATGLMMGVSVMVGFLSLIF